MRGHRGLWRTAAGAMALAATLGTAAACSSGSTRTSPAATTLRPTTTSTTTTSSTTTTTTTLPLAAPPPTAVTPLSAGIPVISRVDTTDRVVFLTMDDGLVRDPAALDLFRRAAVPVTIFPVNSAVAEGADYFRRWVAAGATIEDHTVDHPDMRKLSRQAQRAQICGNADLVHSTFGRRPVLFRPPYGNLNADTKAAAADCGMRAIVLWREAVNNGQVQFQVGDRLQPGDIILMHFRTTIMEDLQAALDKVRADGMHLARLEDYVR